MLGEIAAPKQWPTLSKREMTDNGFPVYGANGPIGYHKTFTHAKPTILVGCRGSCGTIHVTAPRSYANGNAMALDDLDEKRVDRAFLANFLIHRGFADVTTGASQPQIVRSNLVRVTIPLPPLPEQRRIAEVLDRADALRAKRRAAMAHLDTLTQSIFLDMFGDPLAPTTTPHMTTFKAATERITYGFTSPMKHLETGIPIITAKNVVNGSIDLVNVHFAELSEFDALTAKSKPQRGDILVTKDGTIGRCAVVESDSPLCINQSVALIKPTHDVVLPGYMVAYLETNRVQQVLKGMGKGNALAHLQITELAELPMPLPSRADQVHFVRRIDAVQRLRKTCAKSLTHLDTLFASLQHRAFRGEL